MGIKLTPREQAFVACLEGKGDVPIAKVYAALRHPRARYLTNRCRQQYLGGIQTKINRKLVGKRIKPGFMKQTLRLVYV